MSYHSLQTLREIFNTMTLENVEKLADDYSFFQEVEMDEIEFKAKFIKFLETRDRIDEILARFHTSETVNTNKEERKIRLFPFQIPHKRALISGLERHGVVIDSSDTGSGKTYVGLSVSRTERRPIIVVCPKQVLPNWYLLGLQFNVEILVICNYETFIKGKMYEFKGDADLDNLIRVENPYVKRIDTRTARGSKKVTFEWSLPERTLVIYDEAHNCKNVKTIRTQLLISLYEYARAPENQYKDIGIMLLSATIIENKENLKPFLYVLGLTDRLNDNQYFESARFNMGELGRKFIVERRMSRMSLIEAKRAIGDTHTSDVCTKMFVLSEEDRKEIERLNKGIRDLLTATAEKKPKNHLAIRMNNRRRIESLKLQILYNETIKQRKSGYSIVIFVNFKDSLRTFKKMIEERWGEVVSVIIGGQKAGERLKEIENFQSGKTNIIVAIIDTGGTGISLHDLVGEKPRYTLISPPESATKLIQALGRVNRIGAKTNSVQRIIFVAGTIEEKIAESVNRKIKTIGELNTGDKADNLFLFEVYHRIDQPKNKKKDKDEESINIIINKQKRIITIVVPGYMREGFEGGLEGSLVDDMEILDGGRYSFPIKYFRKLKGYLEKLNR